GSRTWMCTIAAPAFAASRHSRAISFGATGTAGLIFVLSPEPVTAQLIMTGRLIWLPPCIFFETDSGCHRPLSPRHAFRPAQDLPGSARPRPKRPFPALSDELAEARNRPDDRVDRLGADLLAGKADEFAGDV